MKPQFPFRRPLWKSWREATFEQICASSWLIRGYYYRVCPECENECEATDEVREYRNGDRVRTYICRNCHLRFPYVMDYEDDEAIKKPTPFQTPAVVEDIHVSALPQNEELVHRQQKVSYHEEPVSEQEELEVPKNLRYLLG